MKDFRKLKVWHKAHALTLAVYQATKGFPKDELTGLTAQMRRASVAVPVSLAEGCGRDTEGDFLRFLQTALGSASELEYCLDLSRDLHYLAEEAYPVLNGAVGEVKQMLASLIEKLHQSRQNT